MMMRRGSWKTMMRRARRMGTLMWRRMGLRLKVRTRMMRVRRRLTFGRVRSLSNIPYTSQHLLTSNESSYRTPNSTPGRPHLVSPHTLFPAHPFHWSRWSLDADIVGCWATPSGKAGKKKFLTDVEMKLRREETARKRKNLSEKKLEDEKAETINRLLKKQSRPRAKRQNTDSSLPGSSTPAGRSAGARTPKVPAGPTKLRAAATVRTPDGDDVVVEEDEELIEGDEGDGEEDEWEDEAAEEVKPTWFRWVSRAVPVDAPLTVPRSNGDGAGVKPTTSPDGEKMQVDGEISSPGTKKLETVERKMVLSFSVPLSLVPEPISESPMDIDGPHPPPPLPAVVGKFPNKPSEPAICAIAGCGAKRKYRLVRDWTIGACGMGHLKVLEAGV
ncbi:hypothetical protein FA13DRAFT_1112228 [Coprinellus micaceus]|uniref:INO80 complex subunit B-like conserved region domain-containing protein n=1 Tax=Coprinellus micaceus TaxID=71717 RepID=A0A4Y7SWB1_COPMI|nr:hypothetical protein FA13DRAFT_1112228 [Coprinellus micaceus]